MKFIASISFTEKLFLWLLLGATISIFLCALIAKWYIATETVFPLQQITFHLLIFSGISALLFLILLLIYANLLGRITKLEKMFPKDGTK